MTLNVQILSTGSYVPERVVTNTEVDSLIGESTNEWLIANVGIRERRWMADDQVTSDLIVMAAQKALQRARLSAEDGSQWDHQPGRPRSLDCHRFGR